MTLKVERTRERSGMPRLLLVATVAGTVSGFLSPFGDYFRNIGWRVDAAARDITSDPECRAHFDGLWDITWSRDPWDPANLKAAKHLQHVVHENEYDIVHVHTPIASFVTRLALRGARRKGMIRIVYTAHGFHCHPAGGRLANFGFHSLERLAGSQTDVLVVINHEDERLARRSGLAGDGRIVYMPGIGVDLDYYSRDRVRSDAVASVRSHLALSSSDSLFLMIAGFQPGKRHVDAVRALRIMADPQAHLAFAGVGPEMKSVQALVERLGLGSSVRFLGNRDDVPTLLAASSGLLLPSVREGLPRSVLEAMAMRVPVVGTRIRGIDELLGDRAGFLVEVGDVKAMSAAMRSIVQDPEKALAIAERAHRKVRRYALSRIISLHHELYAGLLERSPRSDGIL